MISSSRSREDIRFRTNVKLLCRATRISEPGRFCAISSYVPKRDLSLAPGTPSVCMLGNFARASSRVMKSLGLSNSTISSPTGNTALTLNRFAASSMDAPPMLSTPSVKLTFSIVSSRVLARLAWGFAPDCTDAKTAVMPAIKTSNPAQRHLRITMSCFEHSNGSSCKLRMQVPVFRPEQLYRTSC